MMRSTFTALAVLTSLASVASAQAGARRAAPSTRASATVELTLADTAAQRAAGKPALIHLDYGQPHLRGRTLHTADLVPYDQVWRLGANASTLLTTDVNLTMGGQAVEAGRYIVQALPTRTGWTLILQRETSGAATVMPTRYDQTKDAARIPLKVSALHQPVESFTIALVPGTAAAANGGVLTIQWGTVQLQTDWVVR
ncbi:MAG: DUF2911 domain-containing protein [Gemmatimonadaceae bacterium]|nr:DUF2911 domain-containing protein [Gemmatimonadaceae bacterium]